MIQFDTLRICEDKDTLELTCSVSKESAFNKVFIRKIYLDYYKNTTGDEPNDKSVVIFSNTDDDHDVKSVEIRWPANALPESFGVKTYKNGMFFIFVEWGGTPDYLKVDCTETSAYAKAIVFDWKRVYTEGIGLIKYASDLKCKCSDNDSLIDFILRWNALKLAIATCDIDAAKYIWSHLFSDVEQIKSGGCGCRK